MAFYSFHYFGDALYLFVSYWQDTGLGENPSLPIGYGQRIYSPDFESTNFYPDLGKTEPNRDELQIENFVVRNDVLCAEVSHESSISPNFDFIVCNLSNKTNKTFADEKDYTDYANKNGLPLKKEFSSFNEHYHKYLAKKPTWRKWLLP